MTLPSDDWKEVVQTTEKPYFATLKRASIMLEPKNGAELSKKFIACIMWDFTFKLRL